MENIVDLPEQIFRCPQQSSSKDDNEVCGVTNLILLHLGAEDEELSCGMLHLQLPDDGRGIICDEKLLKVVDHHLVHAIGPVAGLDGLGKLLASPDVPDDGLLQAGEELGPVLHHGGESGGAGNVKSHDDLSDLVWKMIFI